MVLRLKEKELAAVAISVAAGCKPCTDYHVLAARKARASDEEIKQAVADALAVRKGATEIMEGHALAQLGERRRDVARGRAGQANRVEALVNVGAAFAVNCASSLETHIAAADAAAVTREEIVEIVKLSAFIKKRAVSHVERLCGVRERADETKTKQAATAPAAHNAAGGGA